MPSPSPRSRKEVKAMSRIKLLLDVVEDMRSLADSLQAVAAALAGNEPKLEVTPAPVQPDPPKPTIKLETLRAKRRNHRLADSHKK